MKRGFILFLCLICAIVYAENAPLNKAQDIGLIPVKPPEKKPLFRNLSMWELGCSLITVGGMDQMQVYTATRAKDSDLFNLLTGNPALPTELKPGKYIFIIDFNKNLIIREFVLRSFTATTSVQLYASKVLNIPSHRSWKSVSKKTLLGPNESIELSLGFLDTRYLMVEIDCVKAGQISTLCAMGAVSVAKRSADKVSKKVDKQKEVLVPYNYARSNEGAKIDYVSGGPAQEANQVLNENYREAYEFPKEDNQAIMVMDLNDMRAVDSVSIVFDAPQKGKFNFIFLDKLPEALKKKVEKTSYLPVFMPCVQLAAGDNSLVELVSLGNLRDGNTTTGNENNNNLLSNLPADAQVVTQEVSESDDKLNLNFNSINTQYVVIVWERDPDVTDGNSDEGLKIYQVNITGELPASEVLPESITPLVLDDFGNATNENINNNLQVIDGVDIPDVAGNPVDVVPPVLPIVSP